jgi:hypothetical protein
VKYCTLHYRPLHFARPARAGSDVKRRASAYHDVSLGWSAGGYWRGGCGAFDGGRFALNVRCLPSRDFRGTYQAKEYPENMMVNKLPLKTKDKLCYYYPHRFLPVPSILAAARLACYSSSSL